MGHGAERKRGFISLGLDHRTTAPDIAHTDAVETCSPYCQGQAASLVAIKTSVVVPADGHVRGRKLSEPQSAGSIFKYWQGAIKRDSMSIGGGLQGSQPTGRVSAVAAAQFGASGLFFTSINCFATHDLLQGFWQRPASNKREIVFTVVTEGGPFSLRLVPQGLQNEASHFQSMPQTEVHMGLVGSSVRCWWTSLSICKTLKIKDDANI